MSELIPVLSTAELDEIDAEISHVPYRAAVAMGSEVEVWVDDVDTLKGSLGLFPAR